MLTDLASAATAADASSAAAVAASAASAAASAASVAALAASVASLAASVAAFADAFAIATEVTVLAAVYVVPAAVAAAWAQQLGAVHRRGRRAAGRNADAAGLSDDHQPQTLHQRPTSTGGRALARYAPPAICQCTPAAGGERHPRRHHLCGSGGACARVLSGACQLHLSQGERPWGRHRRLHL